MPEKIGRYEVISELGRGGFAVVYLANDPFVKRQVAVKVLPAQFTNTVAMRARFQQEAEIIAALEHSAIVPIYDYGEYKDQPFIVMRYMAGGSLAEQLNQGGLGLSETTRILSRISSALDRAHDQGIIHRDLKPGNILFDQFGDAYLSDFGIARLTEASLSLTGGGAIGTPAYMSPEQVYGDRSVDGRSDIYALGVILFEMLTGSVPYEADTPAKLMMKHILEPVPRILSVKPDLPQGCERLLEKAMAKEPDERFSRATEFASAVTLLSPTVESTRPHVPATAFAPRQGTAQPEKATVVETPTPPEVRRMAEAAKASPRTTPNLSPDTEIETPSPTAAQSKPVERKRPSWFLPGFIAAGALLVILLLIGFAVIRSGLLGGTETADENGNGGTDNSSNGEGQIGSLPRQTSEPSTNLPRADGGIPARQLADFQEAARFGRGYLTGLDVNPEGTILAAGSGVGVWLYDLSTLEPIVLLEGHTAPVLDVAWSPDGRFVASAGQDGNVKIWDVENRRESRPLEGHQDIVTTVAWSDDGRYLASAGFDNTVRIWDSTNGDAVQVLEGHEGAVRSVSWPPGTDELVASAGEDGTARIWNISSGETDLILEQSDVLETVLWSLDGAWIITGGGDNPIMVWDAADGSVLNQWQAHEFGLMTMALSPDGQQLLTTGSDGLIRLWELETGLELTGWGGTNNSPITPAWLPDGQQIALTFSDNLLGIYQVEDGEPVVTTKAHTGQIGSVAWAPDGRGLVSGSSGDNLTRLWNIESRQEVGVMPGFTGEGQSLTISDDGSLMAKPSVGIQVFDLSAGFQADFEPIFSGGGDAYVNAAALSPNAEQVAAINWDGFLRVWNLADQALIVDVGGAGAEAIAWSPDGELIATPAHDESLVVIWDSQTGEGLQAIPYGTDANITSLVWSPDGRFLAATDTAGTLNVWERDSWGIALSFQSLGTSLNSIDWSPDGHWLAAGAWSGSLYVWDATGTAVEEPVLYIDLAHLGPVITVAWSPDGNWIATGSHDGTVKIWGQ